MDGGVWWAAVHGVAKSRTRLSDFTFTFHFHALEKERQPTPGFLPGESQGQKSLPGYSACSHKESDTTQGLTLSLFTKDASQFSGSLVSLSCRGLSLNEN